LFAGAALSTRSVAIARDVHLRLLVGINERAGRQTMIPPAVLSSVFMTTSSIEQYDD
jgi:hypothetical protein